MRVMKTKNCKSSSQIVWLYCATRTLVALSIAPMRLCPSNSLFVVVVVQIGSHWPSNSNGILFKSSGLRKCASLAKDSRKLPKRPPVWLSRPFRVKFASAMTEKMAAGNRFTAHCNYFIALSNLNEPPQMLMIVVVRRHHDHHHHLGLNRL